MRLVPLASAGLALAIIAGGASITAVGASRQSSFSSKAQSLQREWDTYQAEGVPASSLAPLRQKLSSSQTEAAWWSPYWWTNTGQPVLADLDRESAAVWSSAVAAAQGLATAQITAWAALEKQLGPYVPAAAT